MDLYAFSSAFGLGFRCGLCFPLYLDLVLDADSISDEEQACSGCIHIEKGRLLWGAKF
jgi:hypothetical protein